jgi:hypothetical protein
MISRDRERATFVAVPAEQMQGLPLAIPAEPQQKGLSKNAIVYLAYSANAPCIFRPRIKKERQAQVIAFLKDAADVVTGVEHRPTDRHAVGLDGLDYYGSGRACHREEIKNGYQGSFAGGMNIEVLVDKAVRGFNGARIEPKDHHLPLLKMVLSHYRDYAPGSTYACLDR